MASEAAATYFTKQLEEKYKDDPKYFANGEFQPNLLSEAEKSQIRDLTAAIGAVVGGTVGDSAFEAQLAGVVGQNAVENNEMGSIIPVDLGRMQTIQSLAQHGNEKGWSDKKIIEAIGKESRGRDPQGEAYVKGLVYGSIGVSGVLMGPELLTVSSLGSGLIGAGTGAATYLNTTPKKDLSGKKLLIYAGGGAATGVVAAATKNPYLIYGIGGLGAYSTQYAAEGKANYSSAAVSAGFGLLGGPLGNWGCSLYCQVLLTYPTQTTATTLIDKTIEFNEEKTKEAKK